MITKIFHSLFGHLWLHHHTHGGNRYYRCGLKSCGAKAINVYHSPIDYWPVDCDWLNHKDKEKTNSKK